MRVKDKLNSEHANPLLMRVEDKLNSEHAYPLLMRVEDKLNSEHANPLLMRVKDKLNSEHANPLLMRVEDKLNSEHAYPLLMRVEDKLNSEHANPLLMRVEDKLNKEHANPLLMRVEDKLNTEHANPLLMQFEDKPSTNFGHAGLTKVEGEPHATKKLSEDKNIYIKGSGSADCKIRYLNYTMLRACSAFSVNSHYVPEHRRVGISEINTSWLPLVNKGDEELSANTNILNAAPNFGFTGTLFRQFWCFNHSINKDHQRLAIRALGGYANTSEVKTHFYDKIKMIQGLNIPVDENRILLSFENSDVVESMNKAGLLVNPKDFTLNGSHIFSKNERQEIRKKTSQALEFIRQADSVLYNSLLQVVACIGYYKAAEKGHLGGTVSSAIGLIWLDPSKGGDWSISFLAEQIVHEYIHTTLFIAEMVRGTYTDNSRLSEALAVSAIRRQKRNYDKSFHSAYVATGLASFHTKTGGLRRASELAMYLKQSVNDLEKVQSETGILDENGAGMLLHLKTFLQKANLT